MVGVDDDGFGDLWYHTTRKHAKAYRLGMK